VNYLWMVMTYTVMISKKNSTGILIYVDTCLCSILVNIESKLGENLFIGINYDIINGSVYRSPSSEDGNDDELYKLINYISDEYLHFIIVVVVDFNCSDIRWGNWKTVHNNPSSLKFLNTLLGNFLLQYVDSPTRGRGSDVPRILDLVISNKEIVTNIEHLAPLGKSDHSLLVVTTNLHEQKDVSAPRPNYNKGQYDELRKFLDIVWDSLLSLCKNDVETMWNVVKEKILEISQ